MKIALILPWLSRGGVLRKASQVALGAPLDWQVTIVSVFSQNDTADYATELGTADVVRLGFRFPETRDVEASLCRTFHTLAPDVVHSMHLYSDICAVPAATKAGTPLVVRSVHGITQLSHTDNYRRTEVRYDWDSWQIEQEIAIDSACHLTLAVSFELFCRLERYGLCATKMTVLHNGVDLRQFTPVITSCPKLSALRQKLDISPDKKVIGIVGRFDSCKDPLAAIDQYCRSLLLKNEAVLLYFGDGPLRTSLEAQAAKVAPGLVFFAGERALAEVSNHLALADVVAMLSRTEGLPFLLLEAMAMGIPVVATAVGGIPEVITDQVDGLLCNTQDSSAQRALEHLVQDARFRSNVGNRARNTVHTRFDVRKKLDSEFALYQNRLQQLR